MYNLDYIFILIFIVIGAGMAIAMYLLSKILSPSSPDTEKLSAYECGLRHLTTLGQNLMLSFI